LALVSKPIKAIQESRGFAGGVIALGVVVAILYYGRVFFITSLAAVTIAFILEPMVALLMRIRFPRSLASFVVCTMALLVVYLIGIGAYTQASGLADDLPKYSQKISEIVGSVQQRVDAMEQKTYQLLVPSRQRREQQQQPPAPPPEPVRKKGRKVEQPAGPTLPPPIPEVRIHEETSPISNYIYERLGSFYQILLMVSFVPFLVYFMLSWRDHIHRSFLQLFHGEDRLVAARSLAGIADMVRAFVVGNFLLGLLLAIASSSAFWIIRLPYPLLVGPLSGFLSLIPYVGLPLALVPPMFVALAQATSFGYFIIFLIVASFHLLALNLLYPKIVGSRVHLNPLVVTFSLMLWGFLWDAAGLVLAIPLTAAIKAICDNVRELRPYGKFLGD
jgi:predicted PurR-regulated permease PerM